MHEDKSFKTSFLKKSGRAFYIIILGFVLAITISFQTRIHFKLIQLALFSGALILKQRQIKCLLPLMLFLALNVLVNLFVPEGKIIYNLFSFPITEGAFRNGLRRGLSLITLLLMSRCILAEINSNDLKLSQFLNNFICYLNFFRETKNSLSKANLFKYLDELLLRSASLKNEAVAWSARNACHFLIIYGLVALLGLIALFV